METFNETDHHGTTRWYRRLYAKEVDLLYSLSPSVIHSNRAAILHRDDGPAEEFVHSGYSWYRNGVLHRIDGPASMIKRSDSVLYSWYQNNKLHRIDGPAREAYGTLEPPSEEYWYENQPFPEIRNCEQWKKFLKLKCMW